ncbi:MAG: glycosyltransferase, partial [Pseudomonadota bacterium]
MSNQTLVHIVQHLKPGGIETMALSLALASQRFADVHVISLEGNGNEVELDFADAPDLRSKLHFLGKPAGVSWATVRELRRILARLQPASVYTHHIGPLLYGGIAGRMAGIKTVVHTVHDVWHLEDQKQRRMEGFLVRALKPIIVVHGHGNARAIKNIWPRAEVQVIPTGVDLQRFAPGDRAAARRA